MLELESPSLTAQCTQQLDTIASQLEHLGYSVKAYKSPSLPHFSRHSDDQKVEILCALHAYCEALQEVSKFDDNLDMGRFVWRFLLCLGITPSEDLFTTLENEKFIQIYNKENLQIFRSLRCFERCSFTLEELACKPWYELWERDNLFFYALTGLGAKLVHFIKPTKLCLNFPYHMVREVDSECNFEFRYKLKSVSVLTRHKRPQAAVLVEDWKY